MFQCLKDPSGRRESALKTQKASLKIPREFEENGSRLIQKYHCVNKFQRSIGKS